MRAGPLLLALALVACATPQVAPETVSAPTQRAAPRWTLTGRVAVKSAEENLAGLIEWQHDGPNDEVLLSTPLGQGVARIVRDAEGVTLEQPNAPLRRAPDAESLTRAALGYALPLAGLVDWVQGRADPSRPFERRLDAEGRTTQLRQDGWVIDYLQYHLDDPARPRKLVVSRDDLEIRLVVDSWQTR